MAAPVRIESSSPSVPEGQTLDLDCVVAGPGSAAVTWYKRGGSLPAGHQVGHRQHEQQPRCQPVPHCVALKGVPPQVSGSRLRVPHVAAADAGEYVCRASLGASAREASVIVTVVPGSSSSYGESRLGGTGGDTLGPGRW